MKRLVSFATCALAVVAVACGSGVSDASDGAEPSALVDGTATATPAPDDGKAASCKVDLDRMMWGDGTMAPLSCCPHALDPKWTQLQYIQILRTLRDALAQAQKACDLATGGAYVTGVVGVCLAKVTLPGAVLGGGSLCFSVQAGEYCDLARRIQVTIDFIKACLQQQAG